MMDAMITSSVLILAVLLLRFLFRNTISRRAQYALWLLVALRLLVPLNLPALGHNVLSTAEPVTAQLELSLSERVEPPLRQALLDRLDGEAHVIQNDAHADPSVGVIGGADGPTAIYVSGSPLWLFAVRFFRGGGMAVMALWFLAANLHFASKLRRTRVPLDGAESKYSVYLCDDIPSPCLFGLFRPAIYVTSEGAKDAERLRYVIAHEETHARHLDPLWSLIRGVCLVIWWFDPLVWLAAYCSKADCELACDESVLARLGESERVPYGEALLALVPVRRAGNPMLAATTMTAGKRQMKDRIKRIAEHKRPVAIALAAVLALTGVVCAATFTGAERKEPETADFSTGNVIQGTIFGTITDVWNENGKTQLRVQGNTEEAVTLTLTDSTRIDPSGGELATGQTVTARYELYYGTDGTNDYKPLISVVIAEDGEQSFDSALQLRALLDSVYGKDGAGEPIILRLFSAYGKSAVESVGDKDARQNANFQFYMHYLFHDVDVAFEPAEFPALDANTIELEIPASGNRIFFCEGTNYLRWKSSDGTERGFHMVYANGDTVAGDLMRDWYDEAEFCVLGGDYDNPEEILIPDRGQTYLEAAQEYCERFESKHLMATTGSRYKYTFVQPSVEPAEDETAHFRENGMIDDNTWCFFLTTVFVPENQRARDLSMAGNTDGYTGGDPTVPRGAYEYYRCGYVHLVPDGWRCGLAGTGW